MEQNINQPSMSLIITGCLLLHFALLYLLGVIDAKPISLFSNFIPKDELLVEKEKSDQEDQAELQYHNQHEDWVAMDSFGAPIIFQDEIEIPRTEQPSQQPMPPQLTKTAKQTSQAQETTAPAQDTSHQTSEQALPNESESTPQQEENKTPYEHLEDGSCILQAPALPQMVCELNYESKQPSGRSSSQKPPLSFAQLAQGFMQYSQRQTYIPVVSNKRGFASPEQIKAMNYMQRILQALVDSYRCVNHTVARIPQPQPATIIFAINRDGSLHTKNIVRSTGSKLLDDFFLDLIDDASLSFPPVPDALQVPFILPHINFNDPRCFQHVGNWMFQSD